MFKDVPICALAMVHLALFAVLTCPFVVVGYLYEFVRLGFCCGIEACSCSTEKIKEQGDS